MQHIFVETNWLFDVAAPAHFQRPIALELFERARRGALVLHVPAIAFAEVRRTILTKCQPRHEADAIRDFLGRARQNGVVDDAEANATLKVLDAFERTVRGELASLDERLREIRSTPNVDVFPANERILELNLEFSFGELNLKPFDQIILASVLARADELVRDEGVPSVVFCERDSDLLPWDRKGQRKLPLADHYEAHRVWVYDDFDMRGTAPPARWPGGRGLSEEVPPSPA